VAGGAGATYLAMRGLELLGDPANAPTTLEGQVEGKRVLILGAGLAGMSAAYELGKLGYDCTILEARQRAGGRAWTVRGGTKQGEVSGQDQTAAFDEGQYFNPGPARIPQHHHSTLNYCKELGVDLELFANVNEAAYYYDEGSGALSGKAHRVRAVKTDMRGYQSELLVKAINQDALDLPLSERDKEQLIEFLRAEGALNEELLYEGSERRGYSTWPGAGSVSGVVEAPNELGDLLNSSLGLFANLEYEIHQQMNMFQIVGGTDKLASAFERQVGETIEYGAVVKEIRKSEDGASVVYADNAGATKEVRGDFCICTIPLSVLRDISTDFSAQKQAAIRGVNYIAAGKIGMQFSRRFWEEDEQIFGGISRTNMKIRQIWYPSTGFLSDKGVLVGYYNFAAEAMEVGELTVAKREELALREGGLIHAQYAESFENSFSVSWQNLPYSLGGFAYYSQSDRDNFYATLQEPEDSLYLAGEHMTYLGGWMAGAFESALKVVGQIHERVMAS
jgi:monoamine oxidase